MPVSPGPNLWPLWQPTKSRIPACFPVFFTRKETTASLVGRISPCDTSRAARLLRREVAPVATPPPSPRCSGLRRRAPSRSRRGSAPHHVETPPPRHPVNAAAPHHPIVYPPAPRLLHTGFTSPVPSSRLPTSQVQLD
ncbi:hypothetical protein BDA96_10G291500 [Sorghum bicolor]|uniref:Uncharacterized protein n=1 Tax=Sorghum bicolor TaxID=4558 RepID=A0A921U2K8_SORBI|nr:hypothetical protein BDA96_10G291500 [Sorghum bicolor]